MKHILFGVLVLTATPVLADVSAEFSRPHIAPGQSVELTFSSDTPIKTIPDLSALQGDFKIAGQQTGQQTSVINGQVSRSFSVSYNLFPLRTGTFTYDNLTWNGEKIQPITLVVSAESGEIQNAPLRMVSEVPNESFYIGQAIPYTVRLGDINDIIDGGIEPPSMKNADIKQIGQDEVQTVLDNGVTRRILIRHYVIVPREAGNMVIKPATFMGMRRVPQDRRRTAGELFEMGILFDGLMGGAAQEQIYAGAEPMNIEVLPKPNEWQGWWLPASSVTIDVNDTIPQDLKTGSTIERVITLTAKGVSAEALPVPDQPSGADLKVYAGSETRDTLVVDNTIEGRISISVVVVPTNGGEITIPSIVVPWFDTETRSKKEAVWPAKTIFVHGPRIEPASIEASTRSEGIQMPPRAMDTETQLAISQSVMTRQNMWLWLMTGLLGGGLIVGLVIFILSKVQTHRKKKPLPDLYPF